MPTIPGDLADAVTALRSALNSTPASLSDDDLLTSTRLMADAQRVLDALHVTAATELDTRSSRMAGTEGLAYRRGFKNTAALLEGVSLISAWDASARVTLGRKLSPTVSLLGEVLPPTYPALSAAFFAGDLSTDVARSIVANLDQGARTASFEAVAAAETHLVGLARTSSADDVAAEARMLRERLDPDGVEPREDELRERRMFKLGRTRNGMTPFTGFADPEGAAVLEAQFTVGNNPKSTPRFLCEEDLTAATVEMVDPRSYEQRNYDILIGTLRAGMTATSCRSNTVISIGITAETLESGVGAAFIDGVEEPIAATTVQKLLCDADYRTVFFGTAGEVLHLGMQRRLFSRAQRDALALRDGGCVWPSCTAPPSRCEAHHVLEWSKNGPTDVNNGALLCSAHHHMLHAGEHRLELRDGRPQLLAPPWLDPAQNWRPARRHRLHYRPPLAS